MQAIKLRLNRSIPRRLQGLMPRIVWALLIAAALLATSFAPSHAATDNSTASGAYRVFEFGVNNGLADWWSAQGDMTFDGNGNSAYQGVSHSQGAPPSYADIYSVDGDGVLRTGRGDFGMITEDGNILVLIDLDATDGSVCHAVGVKKSQGQDNSLLTGDYVMHHLGARIGVDFFAQRYAMAYDGAGGLQWEILADSRGQTGGGPGMYSVGDDGALTLVGSTSTGFVSPDGGFFAASVTSGASPSLARSLVVKRSSGLGAQTLDGQYLAHELFIYDNFSQTRVTRREMNFDGQGSVSMRILEDSQGNTEEGALAYTVDDTGLTDYGDGLLQGMVSADGRLLVLIDTDASDGSLGVVVAVKMAEAAQ